MFSTVTSVKGVASPSLPTSDATCSSRGCRKLEKDKLVAAAALSLAPKRR